MTKISKVWARQVLDSRGKPTVEVELHCGQAGWGRAIVPSGASTGEAEALELRDGPGAAYDGDAVTQAVDNVNTVLAECVLGLDPIDQTEIDRRIMTADGTHQKSALGANALLGVSLAAAHAAASVQRIPLFKHFHQLSGAVTAPRLPRAMTNMISGGLHAGGNLDFQDVLIIPVGARDYAQGLEWTVRIYRTLGRLLGEAGFEGRLVGDEGGYGPRLQSNRQAVELVQVAIENTGLEPGGDVAFAIDVASSHFYDNGVYRLRSESIALTSSEMVDRLADWTEEFPIRCIEDGLAEEDWSGWQELTARLGDRVQLIGDDLFATNPARLRRGIERHVANSVLVKVNQIGTLTETLETIRIARDSGYSFVVSARSGETEDTTIAALAVGVAADYIKIGSIVRGERLAKYNELLRIGERLAEG